MLNMVLEFVKIKLQTTYDKSNLKSVLTNTKTFGKYKFNSTKKIITSLFTAENKVIYYNILPGICNLIYNIPNLIYLYLNYRRNKNSLKNITLKKTYITTDKFHTNIIPPEYFALYCICNTIKQDLGLDKLIIGVPFCFENCKNTGFGILVFDNNTNLDIFKKKLKTAKTMAIIINLLKKVVNLFNKNSIAIIKIEENFNMNSTLFYFNEISNANNNFKFTFTPTNNAINNLTVKIIAIENSTGLELESNINTSLVVSKYILDKNLGYINT